MNPGAAGRIFQTGTAFMSRPALNLQQADRGVLLPVKVVPGASRSKVASLLDGALKIAIAAPPEKGKANKALIKLLAELLNIPKNRISVEQGRSSPHKLVLLKGLRREKVLAVLSDRRAGYDAD